MTTFDFTNAIAATQSLVSSADMQTEANTLKEFGLVGLLSELQQAEANDVGLPKFKAAVYDAAGWTYKVYSELADKMETIEGGKAPAKVSVAYSEAKRAKLAGFTFNQFDTWEAMREACKPEDEQADAKAIFKDIMKTAKTLDKGWNEYIEGALNRLQEEISKAQAK
tara:strand:+ start:212 stop:712 length:501 start_codon:yes stop_codon:yes gene_type:complete